MKKVTLNNHWKWIIKYQPTISLTFLSIANQTYISGIYQWGYDLQSDNTAIESSLDAFCRRDGVYNGSNAVDRQRIVGVSKRLISFTIDELIPIWGLECVYRNGEIVGYIKRGEFGYTIDKSIGTAYIHRHDKYPIDNEYLQTGVYEIELLGNKYPARMRLN